MTSPLNDTITKSYFAKNHNFGLSEDQIFFFSQEMLPFLDAQGELFQEEPGKIALGPDGNGKALHNMVKQGIWKKWYDRGIRYVNFVLIDNPLADPFDAELIGFNARQKADVTIKCIARKNAEEKVGVLVKKSDKTRVIEYTEMPSHERLARDADGQLKYPCANISLFCFSMDFIKRVAQKEMPLHASFKASQRIDEGGNIEPANHPNAWKFETFIFDCLEHADQVKTILYPRESCFSPLKNAEGNDSLSTVQEALLQEAGRIFSSITGQSAPHMPFELAQEFYYPTPDLIKKWKGKPFPGVNYLLP